MVILPSPDLQKRFILLRGNISSMAARNSIFTAVRRMIAGSVSAPQPKTYVVGGASKTWLPFTSDVRNRALLEKYELAYMKDGSVSEAIDTIALFTMMGGFEILSDDATAEAQIREFCDRVDVENIIINVVRDALVYGDAFVENVFSAGGQPVNLEMVNPKTMQITYDDYGTVHGYIQTVSLNGRQVTTSLDKKLITHFPLKRIGRSPYGISTIGTNYDLIGRMILVDEGIANAIHRHGFPKYHVPVGQLGEIIDKTKMEEVEKIFENINSKNEFVTTRDVEIKNIDTDSFDIKGMSEYFITKLTAGIGVPEEILGLGRGSTEATAKVRAKAFEHKVKALQRSIARVFELEIFPLILSGYLEGRSDNLTALAKEEKALRHLDALGDVETWNDAQQRGRASLRQLRDRMAKERRLMIMNGTGRVRMQFNEMSKEEAKDTAVWLAQVMPQIDPFMILSREEIREELGFTTHDDEENRQEPLEQGGADNADVHREHPAEVPQRTKETV